MGEETKPRPLSSVPRTLRLVTFYQRLASMGSLRRLGSALNFTLVSSVGAKVNWRVSQASSDVSTWVTSVPKNINIEIDEGWFLASLAYYKMGSLKSKNWNTAQKFTAKVITFLCILNIFTLRLLCTWCTNILSPDLVIYCKTIAVECCTQQKWPNFFLWDSLYQSGGIHNK